VKPPELCEIPSGTLERRIEIAGFHLAKTQVTNLEYDAFVAATGREPAPFREDAAFAAPEQPVVGVSWFDAAAFCEWLTEETALPFRLPDEDEWEWAARGGLEGARYPWGDESPFDRYPDYESLWREGPERAGLHISNAYGLSEVCENVHEWCANWHDPETKQRRGSRGGSWRHQLKVSTCAARSSIPPAFRYADYGFRVATSQLRPRTT
jgi:formylglycine-generating enzyme required for sulfatase activity